MRLIKLQTYIIIAILLTSCESEWLNVKRDKKLVVPQTLSDLQALMDNSYIMNTFRDPALGEICSDDYYITFEDWQSRGAEQKNAYIWAEDIYEGEESFSWNYPYQQVYYANLALEGLKGIKPLDNKEIAQWNNIKGSALFYRAWSFYQLAQVFCMPYNASNAKTNLGVPLRMESDINALTPRASLQETYDQIIDDLENALILLPDTAQVKTRPSRAAGFGLLSRTYMQMGNYSQALLFADSCLSIYNHLLDYNSINTAADYPFVKFNKEVIYHSSMYTASILYNSGKIDSILHSSYELNDLRKAAFFFAKDGKPAFKGSYDQSRYPFSGIATDEIYLNRAECFARVGNNSMALHDLNTLLKYRTLKGTFEPIITDGPKETLLKILEERRKELIFRGIRWQDLRRLNKDIQFAKTLTRNLNGTIYELAPNSPRYALPIPDEAVLLGELEQNPR